MRKNESFLILYRSSRIHLPCDVLSAGSAAVWQDILEFTFEFSAPTGFGSLRGADSFVELRRGALIPNFVAVHDHVFDVFKAHFVRDAILKTQ